MPEQLDRQVAQARLEAMAALVRLGQLDPQALMVLLDLKEPQALKERVARLALLVGLAQPDQPAPPALLAPPAPSPAPQGL